jgi:hypothetical protein
MSKTHNEHDIISTKKGIWICKCDAHGKDRMSQEKHLMEINAITEMLKPQPAFEEACI